MTQTNTLTAALLETDAAIAARAVADLVAAKLAQDATGAASAQERPNAFIRVRVAIADYQERSAARLWPSYADKAAVRMIAQAADAPADIVRHILRHPDSTLGGTA